MDNLLYVAELDVMDLKQIDVVCSNRCSDSSMLAITRLAEKSKSSAP